jgi:predicted Zn finger-like uncharacterized protein
VKLMIVICSGCSMRLQLDEAKIPSRPFNVRCPKCQQIINAQPPADPLNQGALAVGGSPATENPRTDQPSTAPLFKPDVLAADANGSASPASPAATASDELARLLAALLQRSAPAGEKQYGAARLAWERRRALVCVATQHRDAVARALADNDYQVFVAADTTQAVERMREERMDVVVLDPDFDPVEQGAIFVTREVQNLRPAERRRLFLVQLNATARTLDTHAAFVNNVNLVINAADIENMPRALERAIRDFNDLYRNFNTALNLAAI